MRHLALLPLFLLPACGDPTNAHRLWLALDESGRGVVLSGTEPNPF